MSDPKGTFAYVKAKAFAAMNPMYPLASVFVVQHLHVHADGEECVKMIGVYESHTAAEQAVGRLAKEPGFRDHPKIVDPLSNTEESGFYIDEYEIGKDHWNEGYVTEYYAK